MDHSYIRTINKTEVAEPWLKWVQYSLLHSISANTGPFHKLACTYSLYLGLFLAPQDLKDSICLHVSPRKAMKCSFDLILEKSTSSKVSCFFSIVIVSLAPHREFEQNDYREDAPHFRISISPIFVCKRENYIWDEKKNS